MSYLSSIFMPQTHKARSGYYLNHDILMAVSPSIRKKLIFYFIAEQVPQKLHQNDLKQYRKQRFIQLSMPIIFWSLASFTLTTGLLLRRGSPTNPSNILTAIAFGYLIGSFTNSVCWRVFEGPMLEHNSILQKLSQKYNFGTFDFVIAKKQSHIKKLLEIFDSSHDILHI